MRVQVFCIFFLLLSGCATIRERCLEEQDEYGGYNNCVRAYVAAQRRQNQAISNAGSQMGNAIAQGHGGGQRQPSGSYTNGNAPWCTVDSMGNKNCMYYDIPTCQEYARSMSGMCSAR